MSDIRCPICGQPETIVAPATDASHYRCPRCGEFTLTGSTSSTIEAKLEQYPKLSPVLSFHIRQSQRQGKRLTISTHVVEKILDDLHLPGPAEQAENLLLWLAEEADTPGTMVNLDKVQAPAQIGAKDEEGVDFILTSLQDRGLVKGNLSPGGGVITPSLTGWEQVDALKRRTTPGTRAFMAMAFGNEALKSIVDDHMKPATRAAGFELSRLDDEPRAGLIDERLRVEIRRSVFLVADLSDGNPGAYWEAGFAEGVGKPVIYTCEANIFRKHSTHFDTSHHHTVLWTEDAPVAAAEELKATIRATLPHLAKMNDPDD